MVTYEWKKIWHPEWFQGSRKRNRYFEGWYFKNVSQNGEQCWSFIPGISLAGNNSHAFVQAINGNTGETCYFTYDANDFSFSKKGFEIKVGQNIFSEKGLKLKLNNNNQHFEGELAIANATNYKASFIRPGIMGWYRYVPFMECYHGVVSLNHTINGSIHHNDQAISFDNGIGYIEKDWGSSMPKAWIWIQCNHFNSYGTSFMLSIARIPWVGRTFTGFLGFFHHMGKTLTFATYTGAKVTSITYTKNKVNIEIKTGKMIIKIEGTNKSSGKLKAPVMGQMDRVIHESINAILNIKITDFKQNTIFEGEGTNAGLEMVGDLELLQ